MIAKKGSYFLWKKCLWFCKVPHGGSVPSQAPHQILPHPARLLPRSVCRTISIRFHHIVNLSLMIEKKLFLPYGCYLCRTWNAFSSRNWVLWQWIRSMGQSRHDPLTYTFSKRIKQTLLFMRDILWDIYKSPKALP